ncbi:MAG: AAA family ATPase [Candidatus Pacebacteria bacterium]|nr:AAA family ATPase [Candidatus Paceibacterota bacterium]
MRLLNLEINGFKSFAKKTNLEFNTRIVSIVGPNGSGKSNVVEAFRFVLGEQSMKSMRGKGGADLIFKGSKNLPKGTVASVTIYFDNRDRVFKLTNDTGEEVNLNFDTVSITRSVYTDGLNKYMLNNSEVRLKDIHNLLSSLNIGSSGHHIISQGEADRILNANAREKREMIEDALGLKVFQYKIRESERKLERSNENLKEVLMLKRENAPHLNFLRRQIEKFEKMKELKVELGNLYKEYLKNQSLYLENEKSQLLPERENLKRELEELNIKIAENSSEDNKENNEKLEELKKYENEISNLRRLKGEIDRKLGRIEGLIEARKWKVEKTKEVKIFDEKELGIVVNEIDASIDEILKLEDISLIKNNLLNIRNILHKFLNNEETVNPDLDFENETNALLNTKNEVSIEMTNLLTEEEKLVSIIDSLKKDIARDMDLGRDKEREKFALKVRHQEIASALSLVNVRLENLSREIDLFNEEIKEGEGIIGNFIYEYQNFEANLPINKEHQDELRRSIERIKIKLEDSGLSNIAEVEKEYEEVNNRDLFLAREIEDISASITSLEQLIIDLKTKIDIEFKSGINKINHKFDEFFKVMFGGGYAKLGIYQEKKKKKIKDEDGEEITIDDEESEVEEGIEIDVSLPHKKVKELHSLSGGERSLTSIALLFAMSSVNPPPFLILDETDAALDEANSRRYGDMLELLGERSQLIVVTHNRETMSRANILYGVTVGSDGGSKLLSIKFEEAQAIAK